MMTLPLTPEVFAIFSALIRERVGIDYAPADRELLASKLSVRALDAGFESLLDYYYHLRYGEDPSELDALIDAIVVNESYLFREHHPLEVLVNEFLAPRVLAGERPRVWSAACASGEEPFTLAMLLEDRGLLGRVEIVATDVSARALERARSGELGRRALRDIRIPALLERGVETTGGGQLVTRKLRDAVAFRQLNLLDGEGIRSLGTFDAILCRNVLIYFSEATTRDVVGHLARALRPGGTLWVGVSESLIRLGTSLACEERKGAFYYRRVDG